MAECSICGSRFAQKKCYFCQKHVCASCIVPFDVTGSTTTVKCITCDRKGVTKLTFSAVVWRNKMYLAIVAAFWVFMIFPIPFISLLGYDIDISAFQPVIIASVVLTIPFVFMMLAWQKRAPST